MKTYLDCIPCFFKQGLRAARISGLNDKEQKKILDGIAKVIPNIPLEASPPEIAMDIYKVIKEVSGVEDPFKEVKNRYIDFALNLYPHLKNLAANSKDPLLSSIRIAIAGNIIDFGVGDDFNIEETLKETMSDDFALLDYEEFKNSLLKAETVLYIGDNAGETIFDRVFIEEMNKDVYYAVREEPIINDVTEEDAIYSGLGEVTKIISSGCSAPGTILSLCNKEFLKIFNDAGLVISKGQGNYETLSEVEREVYFLIKAKCPVIARDIGINEGDIVLKKHINKSK
jgi:uncharacterized protein with ATP-grasp and redox domains